MAELLDHDVARVVLARYVTGTEAPDAEVERALEHAAGCERCRRELETDAGEEPSRPLTGQDVGEIQERGLILALSSPEAISRHRAAERMGQRERLSAAGLAALSEVAAGDPDPDVRAAAIRALEQGGRVTD